MLKNQILLIWILSISSYALALTESAKKLIYFETKANAVALRSDAAIPVPHYEIPLRYVGVDFAKRLSADIRDQLIFDRDGEKYVRWILNPEDTLWSDKVKKHFEKQEIFLEKKFYFTGYQTASRSYIVEDPEQKVQFSVKSSTNITGGHWADKKQPVGEAIDSRLNADFLFDLQKRLRFDNLAFMDEPAILFHKELDQAVVIRDLADINQPELHKIYIPGFSVLHDKTGRDLALINGSKDPYAYWTENYIKPVARALAELGARTGMQFDSPHSQNFLVEMTSDFVPTGRIIFRDLADFYIEREMMTALHPNPNAFFDSFTQKDNIREAIQAGFGPLHGNEPPSWVDDKSYLQWKDVFFAEYEKTMGEYLGLDASVFKKSEGYLSGRYYGNAYKVGAKNAAAYSFWQNMMLYKTPKGNYNCSFLFESL